MRGASARLGKTGTAATTARPTAPTRDTSLTIADVATRGVTNSSTSPLNLRLTNPPGERTVLGLAEIVLWTRHMEATLSFYRDLFGLELISEPDFRAKFLSAGLGPGGVPEMIVLFPHPQDAPPFPGEKPSRVLHHLAFAVAPNRYDALESACRAQGLEPRQGVHPVLKEVRTFYVDDPEGNEVEVIALAPTRPRKRGSDLSRPAVHFEDWERERTDNTLAVLTTTGRNGYPHSVPVAVRWVEGALQFETDSNSTKVLNLERDPRISLLVHGKPKWGVLIQGRAEVLSKGTGREQARVRVVPDRKSSWKRKED